MTMVVEKGQRTNIEKASGGSKVFIVGLGWDTEADLDASAVLCKQQPGDADAVCVGQPGFVYFGQLKSGGGGICHSGDVTNGLGNDANLDDERIVIDTAKCEAEGGDQVDIWANIYKARERGLKFSNVKSAYLRIYAWPAGTPVPEASAIKTMVLGAPMLQYDLQEDYSTSTAVQFGSFYLKDGEWRFGALDQGMVAEITDIINSYLPGAAG